MTTRQNDLEEARKAVLKLKRMDEEARRKKIPCSYKCGKNYSDFVEGLYECDFYFDNKTRCSGWTCWSCSMQFKCGLWCKDHKNEGLAAIPLYQLENEEAVNVCSSSKGIYVYI